MSAVSEYEPFKWPTRAFDMISFHDLLWCSGRQSNLHISLQYQSMFTLGIVHNCYIKNLQSGNYVTKM